MLPNEEHLSSVQRSALTYQRMMEFHARSSVLTVKCNVMRKERSDTSMLEALLGITFGVNR